MKKIFAVISMATFVACNSMEQNGGDDRKTPSQDLYIGKSDVKIENRQISPEVLWTFGRVGNVCVSPDGKRVAYTVTYYSIGENKSNSDIYLMDVDGGNKKQLTKTSERESSLSWLPSGKAIAFLRRGKLWNIDPDHGTEVQVSDIKQSIDGYIYAPAEDKILFVIPTKVEKYTGAEIYEDLDKANAYIYNDLMYRHWDAWKDGNYNHIYVGNIISGKVTAVEDIMPGEPWDSPMKPFGGTEEIAWSPDGKTIVYTCKKLTGKEYAFQTNSNLYAFDTDTKQTGLLTPDMPGYDKCPQFSPNGKTLLWLSMKRAGFEADKERIMVMNRLPDGGTMKDVSESLDASPGSLQWTADGSAVYFTAPYREACQIYKLDMASGSITRLTEGDHHYQDVRIAGDRLIAIRSTPVSPAEIYSVDPANGKGKELSFVNKELLDKLDKPTFEKRFITTTDQKQMVTWVVYPPGFDKTKKYPLLMMCTGGPQGALSPSFSYRWNYMLMASQGYVVIIPARRGTSGSGEEWKDAISKNHGRQDEQDLLSAADAIRREPWIDESRMGAMGASYGGYSVFRLAGTHKGRFKAFLAHCGIFDMEFMYSTTEEMFFEEWETGGAPWDKENKIAQNSYAHSPHLLVKNWDTPIMVIHGERDFRVPYSQGMAAYNTAQMLGIESKLLIFPTENHWVLSPQNAIVWQREFFAWFDKYLKH
ncbi:MAG: S9 family peptidase [Tannerella sp.]|jgi:dipeptidyl aminopeptidase/acylaminoacyl peptidase|nr:S9 family peptidase [Tannerella sp.]